METGRTVRSLLAGLTDRLLREPMGSLISTCSPSGCGPGYLKEAVQVSLLLIQNNEKENKIKELTLLLEESRDRVNQLEEKIKLQDENLKESNEKHDHLTSELEDCKMSLQRSVSTQKALEEDLQIATKKIHQLTEAKETQMEEFNKAKAANSLVVTELKTTICNLKELMTTEHQRLEKNEDQLKILTMELQKKSSELEEMTKLNNNKEVELEELKKVLAENQKLLDEKKQFEKIVEELKGIEQELTGLLQTREKKVHDLEIQLTTIAASEQQYSEQVKELKTELENEKNELESVREELKQKGDEVKCKLDKSEENCNNLRKQVEIKSKNIEEFQQEVKKLELELEGAKQKFKEMSDSYKKEIEDKKISEENLLGEAEKAKVTADEAVRLQKEIDIRCQHKIAEMVALMEKHKHQYDKIVEERDSELGLYKSREQEQSSVKASLEVELSNLKNELSSIKKQLEIEREEKEKLKRQAKENTVTLKEKTDKKIQTSLSETLTTSYRKFDPKVAPSQNVSRNFTSADYGKLKEKKDNLRIPAKSILSEPLPKAYTVKTPTKLKIQPRENKNAPTEEDTKKRKMVFEFDVNSDSSESADLLTMVSEEETLKKLCKNNYSTTSHFCVRTPKKTPSSLTALGSAPKFGALRKMREDRWAVVANADRRKKLKEAERLFV
ncbi:Synaptonemal complex protein 1 [Myotis davidii]|uniref:Synaptonemal complex protein 1 n=1 Tax=Myotis davidii TaxID=225400 RepID=L5LWM3_MYODS|nr:Synaptonemal complex protein 1 [Myotis davidii]